MLAISSLAVLLTTVCSVCENAASGMLQALYLDGAMNGGYGA